MAGGCLWYTRTADTYSSSTQSLSPAHFPLVASSHNPCQIVNGLLLLFISLAILSFSLTYICRKLLGLMHKISAMTIPSLCMDIL